MHTKSIFQRILLRRALRITHCSFAIYLIAACAYPISATACFDDEKWAALQVNSSPSLLYVWSPRMVLSAHNAVTAQTAAAAHGLAFWAVHDGRVPEAEINQALAQLAAHEDALTRASAQALRDSQPLCSPALAEREAMRHFPSAWVMPSAATSMTPSVVSQSPIVGAMPAFGWAISLAQRLPPATATAAVPAAPGQIAALPSQADTPQSQVGALPLTPTPTPLQP